MSQALAKLQGLQNVGEYTGVSKDADDSRVIELWLNDKSDNTQEAYRRDIAMFKYLVNKPIQGVLVEDLQNFDHRLTFTKQSTRARARNAVKSLFSYAMKLGYIRFNPAAAWPTPKVKNNLAARIMTEEQVITMLAKEENQRNHAILRLLYNAALRVSELCSVTWADLQPNATTGGQVTVFGKGDETRSVPISKITYDEVLALRNGAPMTGPVFPSPRSNGSLTRVQVFNIVEAAAVRAGIALYKDSKGNTRSLVSPHWLRHAHASHAIDAGAPITLVRDTLGHASIETTNKYAHARPNTSSSTYLKV